MVGYLWGVYVCFDFVFVFQVVYQDFQVQFVYVGDGCLIVFLVGFDFEGGVFFGEFLEVYVYFFLVGFGFGFDGEFDDGFGDVDGFEQYVVVVVIDQGVVGVCVFEVDYGVEFIGFEFGYFFVVVGVYFQQMVYVFVFVFGGVVYVVV